jgi:hypothetical protein
MAAPRGDVSLDDVHAASSGAAFSAVRSRMYAARRSLWGRIVFGGHGSVKAKMVSPAASRGRWEAFEMRPSF